MYDKDSSLSDKDMASIAITHQYPPLSPPPMLDSSGSESNGGDGINPNVLIDLLNEYVVIIKKRKEKIKSIKTQSDTLEFNNSPVLVKHNASAKESVLN